jgi:branched-chain amino acid transport system substrate-binding protein
MRHILAFLLVMASMVNATALGATEPIKVAAIFAKSSKMAFGNIAALESVRYAIDRLNAQGGLLGRPIQLLEFDNRGTAIGSKVAAQKAVAAGVVIGFGANWSSHSLAMAPVFQQARIPMISPISTNPKVTRVGDFISRVCYTDPFQGRVLARFARDDLKARSVAILVNADDQYSEGLAEVFRNQFPLLGGSVLFVDHYLENTADFSPFFRKLKIHRPDVVFHPGHTKMSAFILKQARSHGIDITFLGGDGWNDSMYQIAGKAIEGSYYSNHWHPDRDDDRSRQFVSEYRQDARDIFPVSALADDCVSLFADAVIRANSLNPVDIRNAMANTESFRGVTGTIRFDEHGDPIKSAVILKFDKGTSVYIKTVDP